jgi:beta-1,4-mannosyl-glycoprotein beta-1,4-N-acetylglucosaminyltransferase
MVYDCFLFFNELDLLEIRLNVLNNIVDKFVIVEADRTFSNREKPFYFEENKNRFSNYLEKIIHIKINEYPQTKDTWEMQSYQRNMISSGLSNCNPEDIIIISDLDEIPNPRTILKYKKKGNDICRLKQIHFDYFLNYKRLDQEWDRAKIARYSDIISASYSPQDIRMLERFQKLKPLKHSGWHFSFLGGIENIKIKVSSFSRQEWNNEKYFGNDIEEKIKKGLDIFNRKHIRLISVKISSRNHPEYIVNNREKYTHLIYPDIKYSVIAKNILFYTPYYLKRIAGKILRTFLPDSINKKIIRIIKKI